ncbi:LacI family DNA-binding transcriptional regulator [Isoptericola halotolerans]|nr:LacI family DNA-binding transcriptional regulator [Isoptericola halotolerans]
MSDVARAAGVSLMTVSNVLNGRPNVGADTRLRVLEVVDELGYEINLTARRLRTGRTGAVSLIVPRFDHQYYSELASRVSDALAPEGLHLVVEQSGAVRERELSALSLARLQQYDGVLLSAVGLGYDDLERMHPDVPIVLLGEQDVPDRYHRIQMNNTAGARLATDHLLACGARRIAVLGGRLESDRPDVATQRTEGWAAALRAADQEPDPALVIPVETFSLPEARAAIAARVSDGLDIDGVLGLTDEIAIGAMAGLRDVGRSVPDDVQVVGFDNLRISEHVAPGLTTIDPGHDAMVAEALRLLRQQMEEAATPPEHVVGTVALIERGSTLVRTARSSRSR